MPAAPAADDAAPAAHAADDAAPAAAESPAPDADAEVAADTAEDPVLAAVDALIDELEIDTSDEHWRQLVPAPPGVAQFDAHSIYYWNLETNRGELRIELLPESAPFHVTSTIYLTRMGFYDGLKFHRIITDFMAQGGDPLGNGNGGPGFRYASEIDPDLSHSKRGVVSMANAGPRTDGSQFFIMFAPAPRLNGKHTIFGELAEGSGTLKMLERASSRTGKPRRQVVIEKATISVERAKRR
ncbi:MAG TPA: peptidylprolyl isomerase [Myxococcota bacterium]|nr:peptidylprolyl isomerase [Myxococcota bacterium]